MYLANHIEKSTGNSKLIFAGRRRVVARYTRYGSLAVCYEIALSIGLFKNLVLAYPFRSGGTHVSRLG
jgi:hypothetical protein